MRSSLILRWTVLISLLIQLSGCAAFLEDYSYTPMGAGRQNEYQNVY